MTLQSKLKRTYSTADPPAWLTGSDWRLIDPILAGRLAAVSKAKGKKTELTQGYRTPEKQAKLYKMYLEYKRTGKGEIKLAAKPGTSKHEYGLAVDTSSQPLRGMNNAELKPYGLHKPINSEPWHVEPIETKNSADWKAFAPKEVEDEEVVKPIKILVNGKEKTVGAIEKDGFNYIKLRDLGDVIEVGYNAAKNMPVVSKKGGC